MKKVVIHTDGGCHGNPGPGGWAAVLEYGVHRREISGGVAATTNNRMELQAAIEALRSLKEPCEVEFYTDSQYVKNGVTSWIAMWKRSNWTTKARQPVKNADLWRDLDAQASRHRIRWLWLKGHAGNPANERCDELANLEITKVKASHTPQQLADQLEAFTKPAPPSAQDLFAS
ncbi:MAG: ribonuclease HI [Terrimicrobiaceae bacterium]|nr:ribonuclease HI [Terrimicrobiaceae bacterium]